MDSNRTDSSSVFGVESFLVFSEVVEDSIGDTCCIDNAVAVEDQGIVSFKAIVTVETVKFDDSLRNGTVLKGCLNVAFVVVEVIRDLQSFETYFSSLLQFFLFLALLSVVELVRQH